MSRSATPATRNEATTRLKPPKMTTSAELTIGTAIWSSHGRLRTVADGCARERNVERTHPQPPDPQSETGTLATHSGKKVVEHFTFGKLSFPTTGTNLILPKNWKNHCHNPGIPKFHIINQYHIHQNSIHQNCYFFGRGTPTLEPPGNLGT